MRPYLGKAWFERGGGGKFMSSETAERHRSVLLNGAPLFSDLLTFDRFLHRAGLVKKQATAFFRHPLFPKST